MASIETTARRTAFALAVAVATIAAPAAIFLGSPDVAGPRVVAEPGCSESVTPGDESLDCAPGNVPVMGAPSEMELTDTNPGIHSPAHGGR